LLVNPEKYSNYVAMERGRKVLYCKLKKALYGTLQAAKLFYQELKNFLVDELGFTINPYDRCVANKIVNDRQITIVWHVDDLKISHVEAAVVEEVITRMNERFGKEAPVVVSRGKVHEYLGMTVDFTVPGEVTFHMIEYIKRLLADVPPELLRGGGTTPAANYLFDVSQDSPRLDIERAELFHHITAQLLYLSKRARPDLQPTVPFLCTRVQHPTEQDWKKLGRGLTYLEKTKDLPLRLRIETDEQGQLCIEWWIDASFAVHPDMRSHTGATMSLGKGSPITISARQKLNSTSSTTAELIGVSDAIGTVEWVRRFLEAQGMTIGDNMIYQDNQSAILLEKNGRASSGKRTRHLNIRFFYITDRVNDGAVRIEYCPTKDMRGDFPTKPLQGELFRGHRTWMMGLNEKDVANLTSQECVGDPSDDLAEWVEVRSADKICSRTKMEEPGVEVTGRQHSNIASYYDVLSNQQLSGSGRLGNEWF